jgi:hypothetical protein
VTDAGNDRPQFAGKPQSKRRILGGPSFRPNRCQLEQQCARKQPGLRKSVLWWGDQRTLFRNLGVLAGAEHLLAGVVKLFGVDLVHRGCLA